MEIGKYITQALKAHTAVYVDGLGVFRRVHRSSTYDASRQVYLPPLDYLEFDSLDENAVLLSSYLQRAGQFNKDEAEVFVQQQVVALRATAEDDGEVYLDGVGHLVQYGHALVFKPKDLIGFSLQAIPYTPTEEQDTPPQHDSDVDKLDTQEGLIEASEVGGDVEGSPVGDHEEWLDSDQDPLIDSEDHDIGESTPDVQSGDVGQQDIPAEMEGRLEGSTAEDDSQNIHPTGIFNVEESVIEDEEIKEDVDTSLSDAEEEFAASVAASPIASEAAATDADSSEYKGTADTNTAEITVSKEENRTVEQVGEGQDEFATTTSRKSTAGIWYVVFAVIALIIIGILWYYNRSQQITASQPTMVEHPQDIDGTVSDSSFASEPVLADTLDSVDSLSANTEIEAQAPVIAEQTDVVPVHRYYIVIGAHRSEKQAQDEVEHYNRKGYSHVRAIPKNSPSDLYTRVIWDSYETKAEVDSAARYVQRNIVPDAWKGELKR